MTVSNRKTAHLSSAFLRFSQNTDIEGPDGCLDTALKFLTAKIVYSTLSLSLGNIKSSIFSVQALHPGRYKLTILCSCVPIVSV